MLDAILSGAPSAVEVAGAPVAVNSGFRQNLLAETMDRRDRADAARLLQCWFGDGTGALRQGALARPAQALAAACEWHDAAWSLVSYGRPGRGGRAAGRRVFDWDADAGVLCADFQRLYGIDLLDPSLRMHWYRFMALALSAMRTPGSLLATALSARSPLLGRATDAERSAHERQAAAWALPPTDAELIEEARREF